MGMHSGRERLVVARPQCSRPLLDVRAISSAHTTLRTRVAIGDGSETEIWYYAGTAAKRLIVGERGFCLIT